MIAKQSLGTCEQATSETSTYSYAEAEQFCEHTKSAIALCIRQKEDYDLERAKLQRLVDSGELTNTVYQRLASKLVPECETTLPSGGKTPDEALADYQRIRSNTDKSEEITKEKAQEMTDPCTAAKYDPDHAADYAQACKQMKQAQKQEEILRESTDEAANGSKEDGQHVTGVDSGNKKTNTENSEDQKDDGLISLPRRGNSDGKQLLSDSLNSIADEKQARESEERATPRP